MRKHIQPHIMCGIGDIAQYVLIPGDPRRVEIIASFLDESRKVADYRGFITYTGHKNGVAISVSSSGIGCPSAAIAIEELARIGAKTFIRVGTTGALQKDVQTGDLVIATAAVRGDGTSKNYVPLEFPAVADLTVVTSLLQAARKSSLKTHFGFVLSSDAFYENHENLHRWSKFGVLSVEMETSVIYTIAALKKLRAGSILAVDGNPLLGKGKGEFEPGEKTGELDERVRAAIREEAKVSINAIMTMEKNSNGILEN
ncbi:MAG: nucleoside phosphorylase [Candidatus Bathyarchaeota archaeon]|nr:nucleoside phosphorylase [Candidatus Bathyarchaeota archaeon]